MDTKAAANVVAKAAAKVATGNRRRSPMQHPRHQYPDETAALRGVVAGCGLTEAIKWGKPCYVIGMKNIVLIQRFNEYLALLFFKGSLLKDADGLLFRIGEMEVPRQLRFTSVADVERMTPVIRQYVAEAVELERAGTKVARKPPAAYAMPAELEARLETVPALKEAFAALTPGRQKGYMFQIAAARQATTRAARVDKFVPRILAGKGLND